MKRSNPPLDVPRSTPFQKIDNLFRAVIAVPKAKIDLREEAWKRAKKRKRVKMGLRLKISQRQSAICVALGCYAVGCGPTAPNIERSDNYKIQGCCMSSIFQKADSDSTHSRVECAAFPSRWIACED